MISEGKDATAPQVTAVNSPNPFLDLVLLNEELINFSFLLWFILIFEMIVSDVKVSAETQAGACSNWH